MTAGHEDREPDPAVLDDRVDRVCADSLGPGERRRAPVGCGPAGRCEHGEQEEPAQPRRRASRSGASGTVRHRATAALCTSVAIALLLIASAGCKRDLVERAIAARGGPLLEVTREVRAKVHQGIPGDWTWEIGYRVPGDVRWTLHTWGEEQRYVLEQGRVSFFLGASRLPAPPEATAAMHTQSHWLGVVLLDVLRDRSAVSWSELSAEDLPAGVPAGIEARFSDGGPPYRLYFDDDDLLVRAEGEVSLPPIGEGRLRARFRDFRKTEGYVLPYRTDYELDGRPFFEEEVVRYSIVPGTGSHRGGS